MPNGSTSTPQINRPDKPYKGYPLHAHASGQWAKKIGGKRHYFGSWRDDPDGLQALERYNREWPYLKDGRTPPPENISADGLTLRELVNDYLVSKEQKVDDGALSIRSFKDYFRTCEIMLDTLGKDRRVDDLRPEDFRTYRAALAKRFGPVTLKNQITRAAMISTTLSRMSCLKSRSVWVRTPNATLLRKRRVAGGRHSHDGGNSKSMATSRFKSGILKLAFTFRFVVPRKFASTCGHEISFD
jgi:hypothetical protein